MRKNFDFEPKYGDLKCQQCQIKEVVFNPLMPL